MTTSGTSISNLDLLNIVEESFERCGKELRTGYDLKTARRSLNLLTMEWANRGINLWTLDEGSIPLVKGQAVYDLPTDTIDLLDQVIRTNTGTNQNDIYLSRISASTYATIPSKNTLGRPYQVWIDRQSDAMYPNPVGQSSPRVTLWQVPDRDNFYTLVYWRLRRMQDAGKGVETQDIPFRFLPALVAGLAYHMSFKIPDAMERMPALKAVYDEQWMLAADEDREKATLSIPPDHSMYRVT